MSKSCFSGIREFYMLHFVMFIFHCSSHFTEAYAKSFKGILSPILFDHFGLCFAYVSMYSPIFSVLLLNKVICRWYPHTFLCCFPVQWHLALPSLFHWQLMPGHLLLKFCSCFKRSSACVVMNSLSYEGRTLIPHN